LSESDSETEKDPPTPRKERRCEKTEVDSSERREERESVPSTPPSDPTSHPLTSSLINTTTTQNTTATTPPPESSTSTTSVTLSPSSTEVSSNDVQVLNLWSESPPSPLSSSSSSSSSCSSSCSSSSNSTPTSPSSIAAPLPSTFSFSPENQFIYYVTPCISPTPTPIDTITTTTTSATTTWSHSPLQSGGLTFTSLSILSPPSTMHFPFPNYSLFYVTPQLLPSQFGYFDTRTIEGVSPSDVIPSEFESFDSSPCLF
jgi:hypothetical protein